ncbi:MAG: Gfo/Idh/MocA family oxidoreductase [Lentisphaerae bacterium]|nr:Gfo/Idh/MocA family oxidoreductase [Lentisphaerota bacterium]
MTSKQRRQSRSRKSRPIRLGVVGLGRGHSFTGPGAEAAGFQLVAVCDQQPEKLKGFAKRPGVATYTDFDRFLKHDLDAVALVNYFHQHAPLAIQALRAGKHVISETAACHTLAEGVALIRAVEQSGCTYMFAENYPYNRSNQEMRRLFRSGELGTFLYGECEYVHPMNAHEGCTLRPGLDHWRNWVPATYYCTHGMGPAMFITDTRPTQVNGFVVPFPPDSPEYKLTVKRSDCASMIAVRMDNRAVVKLLQGNLRRHSSQVRIYAARGYMEGNGRSVTVIRQQWHERRRYPEEVTYLPDFPEMHELALRSGHGGGDFFMLYHFADAIRRKKQPYLDVYRGVAMSAVGIQAYRSALADGAPLPVPDFRKAAVRRQYEADDWSPDPARRRPGQPWPSIDGDIKPSATGLKHARQIWRQMGYKGR